MLPQGGTDGHSIKLCLFTRTHIRKIKRVVVADGVLLVSIVISSFTLVLYFRWIAILFTLSRWRLWERRRRGDVGSSRQSQDTLACTRNLTQTSLNDGRLPPQDPQSKPQSAHFILRGALSEPVPVSLSVYPPSCVTHALANRRLWLRAFKFEAVTMSMSMAAN